MTLTLIAVIVGLLAGSVYALWRAHEEAKAERQKFQRIAQANSESRQWPAPQGRRVSTRNGGAHDAATAAAWSSPGSQNGE